MNSETLRFFRIPLFVLFTIIIYLISLAFIHIDNNVEILILLNGISLGSLQLIEDTIDSILKKDLALDYIAILAIITGLLTQQFLVSAVIVLMLSGGQSLEKYAMNKAKKSLTKLSNRIPNEVNIWNGNKIKEKIKIEKVAINDFIAIRKGEVIPLDGELISIKAQIDESSLTGEPYTQEKVKGSIIRSGTVNDGDLIVLKVTKGDKDSSYKKIIELVKKAQNEKSPFIRLADQYSGYFTIITLLLAGFTYLISQDPLRILAVLVIATPCPLILATPIALIGGVNSAAREKIIIKEIQSLEILARVNTIIFDKTGTLTLGKPVLSKIKIFDNSYTEEQVLQISASIEMSSLHPFAKAIVRKAKDLNLKLASIDNVKENAGIGISGNYNNKIYTISKSKENDSTISLYSEDKKICNFDFEDKIKPGTIKILEQLLSMGLELHMFTGDKQERAEKIINDLKVPITLKSECTPEEKNKGIEELKRNGKVTAMIGDGINDAPALALADVGLVFSNEEQTAASEAADVVFLTSNIDSVYDSIKISKRTIHIAKQSILSGISLSIIGMLFASFGFIIPVIGAVLQELIDVSVIFNALRASRK